MKDFPQMPSPEETLRRKISTIEKIPTGVTGRAEAILVLLGEKPALEMFIPNKNDAAAAIASLQSIGLLAEISPKRRKSGATDSAYILVARSQAILDELKLTHAYEHHRRYGELMGYPKTAIDAFLGENGEECLASEEQRELMGDIPYMLGDGFTFSKKHKEEELAIVKHRIKLVAQHAPGLFYDLFREEQADKILNSVLHG